MPVSLIIWRFVAGRFEGLTSHPQKCPKSNTTSRKNHCSLLIIILLILLLDGDTHPNPGPKKDKDYNFIVCHWNVNSIPTQNFSKLSLLSSYNSIYKYDLICLSETFLDSSFLPTDERLVLDGYNLVRSDHPNHVKRGGVCVYIKNSLSTRICNISNLNECVVIELNINKKKGYIISLYRSPSQSTDEFEEFLIRFDQTLHNICSLNPSFTMILGDFNAKSTSWCDHDITSAEGYRIESLTSFYSFSQLISTPTPYSTNVFIMH